jgi:Domain of unknown function (DUF5666)
MNDESMIRLQRRELVLAALAVLGGCGGVDSGGTGTGASSTISVGPITGFGSVIVKGIRFDDGQVTIDDDEGNSRSRSDLRLGARVEVLSSPVEVVAGVSRAVASSFRVRTELRGPVDSVDAALGRIRVLGQAVDVSTSTVLEVPLSSLAPGTVVEVHGTLDLARSRYVATRVERRTNAASYKVRAAVSALDLAAGTLQIGSLTVDWSSAAPADPSTVLAPGRLVQVVLSTVPSGAVWRALVVEVETPSPADREAADFEGRITAFVSPQSFAVDGVPVDARAAVFDGGTAGLVLGAKVEVAGRIVDGVLVATEVEVEDDEGGDEDLELHGAIESVDAPNRRFVVRGVNVQWTASTLFDSSSAADIVQGRQVELRGRMSPEGTVVEARRIHVQA